MAAPEGGVQVLISSQQADKVMVPPADTAVSVLVEEVVADFDLGAGSEVVWQQHDGHGDLAQVVNLIKRTEAGVKCGWVSGEVAGESAGGRHTYRVVDPPHQDAQNGIAGSQDLHLLLHKVLLLGLPLGRQLAERHGSDGGRRGHGFTPTRWPCVSAVSGFPSLAFCLCKAALKSAFVVRPALTPPALNTSERGLSQH